MSRAVAPLQLYRRILRLHRRLPVEHRGLGDSYVKAEFRRHQDAKPEFVPRFLDEWIAYADTVEMQLGLTHGSLGRDLDEDVKSKLSDDQEMQLNELRSAVRESKAPPPPSKD